AAARAWPARREHRSAGGPLDRGGGHRGRAGRGRRDRCGICRFGDGCTARHASRHGTVGGSRCHHRTRRAPRRDSVFRCSGGGTGRPRGGGGRAQCLRARGRNRGGAQRRRCRERQRHRAAAVGARKPADPGRCTARARRPDYPRQRQRAYAYLERAAALDAGDERVRRARNELGAAVAAAALDLIERGELDQAERARAAAADLDAGTRSLDAIERALEAAREARAAERHASLLRSARERLAAGRLVEPDDDSAWFYLSELRRENLAHPELADAWRELITALEDNVRAELGRQDWPQAEARLAELERAEPDSAAARELAKELEISRRQQAYLAVPAPPSELVVLERSPLEYPRYALRYQIEGTVVLEFIVDRGGRAREISVVEAEPPGRFEEAAIAAVEKYRFAPFEVDGHVYERRVRLPVSFKLR